MQHGEVRTAAAEAHIRELPCAGGILLASTMRNVHESRIGHAALEDAASIGNSLKIAAVQ